MPENKPMADAAGRAVLTVSQLNREIRELLETGLPMLWVEGEISNLAQPASGHLYFSLKDSRAQIRCAMFKGRNRLIRFQPRNGMQVIARGRVSLYEPRGDYQFIVDSLEETGDGALRRQFEELKARLAGEGLFDASRKKPLPAMPRCIGVITSPSGAAIRDVLHVLKRRFPAIRVLIYPVPVQGKGAAGQIAAMIREADSRGDADVLLVTRGGGSLEDLWAFNEEILARAVAACELPIVSAVGHEIDFSICDFVADQRAPTPSAAAEMLSPDAAALAERLHYLEQRLARHIRARLSSLWDRFSGAGKRLGRQHPLRRLRDNSQRLDELQLRLSSAVSRSIRAARERLLGLEKRLAAQHPRREIQRGRQRTAEAARRLRHLWREGLGHRQRQLAGLARALDAVSPLATVARGYAIVSDENGHVVRSADRVAIGAAVTAQLARGRLHCRVETVEPEQPEGITPLPRKND